MKLILSILVLLLCLSSAQAQVDRYILITNAEYFINTDPGEGNGTPIDVDMGYTVNFSLDNINYNYGDIVFVRVKNENGVWSAPSGRKLGENVIVEACAYRVTYPIPDYPKLIEVKMQIKDKNLNGLIATAVSDPVEGDNLKPGDTILVQFKGINNIWSPLYPIILAKPDLQIPKPLNLKAKNIGIGKPKVKLTWTDNSEAENQFAIEKSVVAGIKKDGDKPLADWEEIARVDKNTSEYIDESIEVNKEYQWRIRALGIKDWMASEYSNVTSLIVTGIEESMNISDFTLNILPNPAYDQIYINFYLPEYANITLTITNSLGQRIANILNNIEQDTGGHNIEFYAGKLTAGVYFCTLKAGKQIETRKIMIIR